MAVEPPILLAEDEETDVFFLRRALTRAGITNQLIAASDGQHAIQYLNGEAPYHDRTQYPLPGLFLLDLKMPVVNGFEVLDWLRDQSNLKNIPVVVLTSSAHKSDMEKALALGAAEYRVKPSNVQDLVNIVRELHDRWLKTPRGRPGSGP